MNKVTVRVIVNVGCLKFIPHIMGTRAPTMSKLTTDITTYE